VITGGTSGIGLETGALLAENGIRSIIINGRNAERGESARKEISLRAPEATVTFVQADVSTMPGVERLFRSVSGIVNGHLAVLVNSTGGDFAPAALPRMSKGSVIVNVGSDAAKVPTPGETAIGAAMSGMAMFSRSLAMEAKRDGIRVNMVTPSVVDGVRLRTRMAAGGFGAKLFEKAAATAEYQPDYSSRVDSK
jgi:2-hydroxycyclohexanecarboxyl-CoA dehydrogenase